MNHHKKIPRRILSLLLAVIMLAGMIPFSTVITYADDGTAGALPSDFGGGTSTGGNWEVGGYFTRYTLVRFSANESGSEWSDSPISANESGSDWSDSPSKYRGTYAYTAGGKTVAPYHYGTNNIIIGSVDITSNLAQADPSSANNGRFGWLGDVPSTWLNTNAVGYAAYAADTAGDGTNATDYILSGVYWNSVEWDNKSLNKTYPKNYVVSNTANSLATSANNDLWTNNHLITTDEFAYWAQANELYGLRNIDYLDI